MPFVTSEKMLLDARRGGYAVGAFNAENMEMVKAIIAAAEELRAPVMIQTTSSTIKYGSVETYAAIVSAEAMKASVPVCLHLDHGSSFGLAVRCVMAGYTSVMMDGSKLPFEENIAAWNFVSKDKKEVLAFWFEILSQPAAPVHILKLKGIDENAFYENLEDGRIYGGDELMYCGISIPLKKQDFRSVFYHFRKVEQ